MPLIIVKQQLTEKLELKVVLVLEQRHLLNHQGHQGFLISHLILNLLQVLLEQLHLLIMLLMDLQLQVLELELEQEQLDLLKLKLREL